MYLCFRCGYKAQFRVYKLASPCTAKRSTYGQGNVEKARHGTLSAVPNPSSSSQPSHALQLHDNSEPLSPIEIDAIRLVENQMHDIQSNLPYQLAVPSDSEMSSVPPSSVSEEAPVSPEGSDTDSGSE